MEYLCTRCRGRGEIKNDAQEYIRCPACAGNGTYRTEEHLSAVASRRVQRSSDPLRALTLAALILIGGLLAVLVTHMPAMVRTVTVILADDTPTVTSVLWHPEATPTFAATAHPARNTRSPTRQPPLPPPPPPSYLDIWTDDATHAQACGTVTILHLRDAGAQTLYWHVAVHGAGLWRYATAGTLYPQEALAAKVEVDGTFSVTVYANAPNAPQTIIWTCQ